MSESWCIYVDVQGFRRLWGAGDGAVIALGELMRAIFRIGRLVYPDESDRLFAHQFGDGFLIKGDFREESLDRCVAIAVAVMRHVTDAGSFARAAIAEGEVSDIQTCYPREVLDCLEDDNRVALHGGRMTIIPVMGPGLTRAVAIAGAPQKGPLLLLEEKNQSRITDAASSGIRAIGDGLVSIDWIHYEAELLSHIQRTAHLHEPKPAELEQRLREYCSKPGTPPCWRDSVHDLLGV